MDTKCRLFESEATLRDSHIIPDFVIQYIKKTGSKYFRNFSKPNKREQNGPKYKLLSEKAEQKFSISEKWFSENIFLPYLERSQKAFEYDQNLYYFAVSILWRTTVLHIDFIKEIRTEWYFKRLLELEKTWRKYLAEDISCSSFCNVEMLLTDRVKSINFEAEGFDFYITRAIDCTVITSSDKKYIAIYAKFLRFIFWSVIETDQLDRNVKETLINPKVGQICFPQILEDDYLIDFLVNRTNQISKLSPPSRIQLNKIIEERDKEKNKFWNTDAGNSITNDLTNLNTSSS